MVQTTTPATVRPEHLDAARMRSLQSSARICARVGGHRLGRFHREQTGTKLLRVTSAVCGACNGRAECTVGAFGTRYHANAYGGAAVMFRCPARIENRCQEKDLYGATAELRDAAGETITATVGCDRPYSTVWSAAGATADGPGLKLCLDHARRYRRIAEGPNVYRWAQISGPTDY